MNETLFGSLPQLWQASPLQAYGYFPPPQMAAAGRPMTAVSPALVAAPTATLPGSAAPFGREIPDGVTAQTLLAAVAIRRGQPMGPTTDAEVEDFISDALDLAPGANDVEVRCESGRVVFTGSVSHKRLKRDIGEIAWAIPTVSDVQNNVTIVARRRSRGRDSEQAQSTVAAARKQSA